MNSLEQIENGPSCQIMNLDDEMKQNQSYWNDSKMFHDSIHGTIDLHPLCIKIIDTPEFQRLRFVSQVSSAKFVFPSATHSRFEHSIGVCHLAGQFIRALQGNQPELDITDKDVLCVEIAGLCHDLGHGPFSHLFETFLEKARPGLHWRHEECSIKMFDHLLRVNNLHTEWKRYHLSEQDLIFVKELILGPSTTRQDWPYDGRPRAKGFLYQIVANKTSGVDVDKWDYFLRDGYNMGIKVMFEYSRLIKFSRVLKTAGDDFQICFRDKEVDNLYDMFHIRKTLHRIAYQHRVSQSVSCMYVDALLAADKHIQFSNENGSQFSISEAIDDLTVFTKLNDTILMNIYNSNSAHPDIMRAKGIIHRIFTRRLYSYVGNTGPTNEINNSVDIVQEILLKLPPHLQASPNDFIVKKVSLNYGMGSENPMEWVRFYSKCNPDVPLKFLKEEDSVMLRHKFQEKIYRILCKREEKEFLEEASAAFSVVCKQLNLQRASGDSWSNSLTPDN